MFRVTRSVKNVALAVYRDGELLKTVKKIHLAPAEMERIMLSKEDLKGCKDNIKIQITEVK
jgi:predicted amidohydrolase